MFAIRSYMKVSLGPWEVSMKYRTTMRLLFTSRVSNTPIVTCPGKCKKKPVNIFTQVIKWNTSTVATSSKIKASAERFFFSFSIICL